METLLIIQACVEILVGVATLGGVLWGGWKLIIKPIKEILNNQKVQKEEHVELRNTLNDKVLPVINSLEKEFSKNGGKSIKDQINKINDAVSLAELRSKMIASNLMTTGAYECNSQGECTWVNRAMCEMFGLTFDQCLGNGWLSGLIGIDRADIWKNWIESINLDIPYEAEYIVHNHTTNKKLRVRSSAVSHKSVDGKILGFYGTIIKIGEIE
jgi:PAS domain-containing protein